MGHNAYQFGALFDCATGNLNLCTSALLLIATEYRTSQLVGSGSESVFSRCRHHFRLPPKADLQRTLRNVSSGPKADPCCAAKRIAVRSTRSRGRQASEAPQSYRTRAAWHPRSGHASQNDAERIWFERCECLGCVKINASFAGTNENAKRELAFRRR
jgi:hypothetical protein